MEPQFTIRTPRGYYGGRRHGSAPDQDCSVMLSLKEAERYPGRSMLWVPNTDRGAIVFSNLHEAAALAAKVDGEVCDDEGRPLPNPLPEPAPCRTAAQIVLDALHAPTPTRRELRETLDILRGAELILIAQGKEAERALINDRRRALSEQYAAQLDAELASLATPQS